MELKPSKTNRVQAMRGFSHLLGDTTWLYRYYSGDRLTDIAADVQRDLKTLQRRIYDIGLPTRPRGRFSPARRKEWLRRVARYREIFKPSKSNVSL